MLSYVLRRRLHATACLGAALLTSAVAAQNAPASASQTAAPAAPAAIRDLHYGDTLFTFYQSHYFQSITELMVSQHFNRVSRHKEEAEVLRGGMLLSYGKQRQAGDIFERMVDLGAPPAARDRAWFYLAKIRYQRGYTAQAQDALARIGSDLEPQLQEELGLLRAQVSMAAGDYAAAAQGLAAMDAKTPEARYVRFNLGVALIKSDQAARGTALLDALGQASAEDEEYRDLRDRANLALGFAALAAQQWPQARSYLERVRLHGLQANKALLGLGWAESGQKQNRQALVPWLELVQREASDAAVLEAYIAVPYAYAELGAYSQAAEGYAQAISTFESENNAIEGAVAALRSGRLVQDLVAYNPGGDMGWFWGVRRLPEMPFANQLAPVLASHAFQEALKNYRDLLFLQRNLQDWSERVGVLGDMVVNRQKAFTERLPTITQRASDSTQSAAPLRQRKQALVALLAQGQVEQDGLAFATAHEQNLLQRVQRVQATLVAGQASTEGANHADLAERARLAAGVLQWNLAQSYPARQWQAQSALQSIQASLEQAERLEAQLQVALKDEPTRFAALDGRLRELSTQLPGQLVRVNTLTRDQQQALQDLAVADLQRAQQNISQYSSQARFALAQLYDRASVGGATGKEAERAAKP